MSHYINPKATCWDDDISHIDYSTSLVSLRSTVAASSPTLNVRKTVWSSESKRKISPANQTFELVEGEQSTMQPQNESLITVRTNFFRRTAGSVCAPSCKTFFRGLIIGCLIVGIALAVVLTIWLKTGTQRTSTSYSSSTSKASTSTQTTATSTSSTSTTSTTASTSTTSITTTTSTTTTTASTSTSSTTTTTATTTTTTTSTTTSSTTTTTTSTTTALTCISNLTGVTTLLHMSNVVSQGYTFYSYTYTAITTSTRLTLAFRMDSNNWSLDTLSMKRIGTTTELLANGDFESGNLNGWTTCNVNNALNYGFVQYSLVYTYSGYYYWKDASTGAVDSLYQYVTTVVGANYTISFYLRGDGGLPNSADVYVGS